ncbi:hypothetical protein AVEN_147844-1 [Araneus ventricosus]|uniref:Uncharacterized protein n=1 Tax=Araneus ventricosus TaxID=182803 RepID=A0A4Y2CUF9_ARAVE|nr:hypothetical protein AVEN_147844-1 [Araneus ventricosus]
MAQTVLIHGPLLPNDNFSGWWRWNYCVGNVFLEYTGSIYICGYNSIQHSLPQHHCRSREFVYEYMVMITAGQCTVLDRSQIGVRNINQSVTCFHDQIDP